MESSGWYEEYCAKLPIVGDPGNHPSDYDRLAPEEKEALHYWIKYTIDPGKIIWKRHSSYEIKHCFEREAFYISNGQFKGAMLVACYVPRNEQDLNWMYRIRPLHGGVTFTLGRFDLDFYHLLEKVFALYGRKVAQREET